MVKQRRKMNGLIDDITADGWMALAICILRGVPPDEGFRLLYNPARRNVKWNEEMFKEIELMRQNGMKWADIGAMYQVDGTTVCKSYYRFKGKKKKNISGTTKNSTTKSTDCGNRV